MSGGTDKEQPRNQPSYRNTDSSWSGVEDWINRATKAQNQEYSKNAGLTYNKATTLDQIETYILTTAFGSNGVKKCCLTVSLKFWYNHIYRTLAAKIRKKIEKYAGSSTVKLNIVFIMALLKDKVKNKEQNAETTVPVFCFEDSLGNMRYIDLFARVYKDWNDYLTDNWIDPALMCYSKVGHYGQNQPDKEQKFDSDVLLDLAIQESPACGKLRSLGRWAKKTLAVVTPILTVASVLGVIPGVKNMKYIAKLSPIVQSTNQYYRYVNIVSTIAFSVISIGDTVTHGGWDENLFAEVTVIATSVLTLLADDFAKRYLKGKITAGQEELTTGQAFFFNLFAWSRCASSVVSVLTTLIAMMYKPECSAMDYFLLASSLYSCYGMLTSPKTAQGIFDQVKAEYIKELLIADKKEAGEKKTENDQSTEKDTVNTDFNAKKDETTDADGKTDNADPGNTDENEGEKEPSEKILTNEELIEQRDELAKKMTEGEDDVVGKAAYKYYEKNFVLAFKGTENEYVMNNQLVRMMENAPDIRELFCEIALTETTLDIRNGILLVNGQLNIDGGALAQVHNGMETDVAERLRQKIEGTGSATSTNGTKGDREILFEETKVCNKSYQDLKSDQREQAQAQADADFLRKDEVARFAANKGSYRLFFEANARNFDRQFARDIGSPLDVYEIEGKTVIQNMSTADKYRLHQQLFKHSRTVKNKATGQDEHQFRSELFDAAMKLANVRECESVRDLASYIGIMAYESRSSGVDKDTFLNDVIGGKKGRLETIQANINALMPHVEEILANQNQLGFHNSLEAYEHVLQHRRKTENPSDQDQRICDAKKYLLTDPQPPNPQPRWNQWGTKQR